MDIKAIKELIGERTGADLLRQLAALFPGEVVFSTSFGIEDQVITEWIGKNKIDIGIFTLDTGRLFKETYSLWSRTMERYQLPIKAFAPEAAALEAFISAKGPNSFYESVANRKECCRLRKIEPLHRAIKGKKLWITGIRADQSPNRHDMDFVEYDAVHDIIKVHPLFDWTFDEVKAYCKINHIPYNVLHDKGFPSIGCQPCTRAIQEGEDFRAGRWWWEDQSKKECGLHSTN